MDDDHCGDYDYHAVQLIEYIFLWNNNKYVLYLQYYIINDKIATDNLLFIIWALLVY